MSKQPAKKPAARTHKPGSVLAPHEYIPPTYSAWSNISPAYVITPTSSRTQPPKPPVKVARVKRPRDKHGWSINYNSIGTYAEFCDECFSYDPRHIRAVSAWLLHAAAYIEQEAKRT